ncbi:MAG: alpha/beta hydrolase [Rubrivivax sp.]|nr:alpha/beta hydrolase [Pyrinomonadaceae bacterium]
MNSNAETNAAMPANQNTAFDQTTVKGESASVNGLKMYYEIHGAGRPLVLLHGSFMWGIVYLMLAEGRQTIVVDMQGHGRTADIDRPFTFEQMADDVAALLKQLKIEETDVFGYSMGGTIGLALAIRHPALVRRLAIYGSVFKNIEESYPPDVLKDFKAITPETFAPEELKEPYDKMSPVPNWKGLVAKIVQMEKDFKGFSPEQMKALNAEVFIGAGDHYDVGLEHVVEMHNLIPKSQLAVFPNTDHIVLLKNPNTDKVLPQIKEFLNT